MNKRLLNSALSQYPVIGLGLIGTTVLSTIVGGAELTLYAVEINVVREYRLWPRSSAPPPYTAQDQRAFEIYAQVEKREKGEDILVKVEGEDDREKTSG